MSYNILFFMHDFLNPKLSKNLLELYFICSHEPANSLDYNSPRG